MSEDTIFQASQHVNEGTIDTASIPQTAPSPIAPPIVPPVVPQPVFPSIPETQLPIPPSPPILSMSSPAFPIRVVIKIIIGIIVVGLIVFFGIRFFLSQSAKNDSVTLTYWGLWEDNGVMKSTIANFEKQYPHIHIAYIKEDPKEYVPRLLTRIKNDNGPDIFRFHNSWVPILQPVLLPLSTDVISKTDMKSLFYPVVQQDLEKNGAIYGVPLNMDTLSLFTNTSLFQAAGVNVPATWSEFIDTARALTVKDEAGEIKTAGAAMGTFDNITHAPDIISMLFLQNGANIRDLKSTSKSASDALDFFVAFSNKDKGSVWDSTLEQSLMSFAKGNVAMYFGYSWDIFTIKAINPTLSFQVSSVPQLPERNMTIASYWPTGISVKSKHQKEAFLFMHYLVQKDTEERLFSEQAKTRLFGELYARKDLRGRLKDNTLVYPFITQADNAGSSFFAGETLDDVGQTVGINARMNSYLGNAIRSVLGNTSSETAVDTLNQGVQDVLSQYGQ